MASRIAACALGSLTVALLVPSPASAELLYFHNKRAIQVDSWQIKGHLIYLTMGGKTVYMKADSVDWDTTEKLKQSGVQLEKVDYAVVDNLSAEEGEGAATGGPGSVLTAADLRKVGSGYKMRRAGAPSLGVEVLAEAGWIDSGVNVRAGQTIGVHSTGRVIVAQGKETGPEGLPTPGGAIDAILSDRPHGALLIRVGLGGEARAIGRGTSFTASTTGRLYLAVNDKTANDNSGSFSVRLDLPAPPAVPGAATRGMSGESAASPTASGAATSTGGHKVQQGMHGGIGRAQNSRDALQGASSSQRTLAGGTEE